ncbi:MAG: hypothetical protein IIW19_02120, partial [Clostridia bacterium]|nr:hypothetical protein [Clostridia bacterium]
MISNVPLLSANAYPLLSLVVTICKRQREREKQRKKTTKVALDGFGKELGIVSSADFSENQARGSCSFS